MEYHSAEYALVWIDDGNGMVRVDRGKRGIENATLCKVTAPALYFRAGITDKQTRSLDKPYGTAKGERKAQRKAQAAAKAAAAAAAAAAASSSTGVRNHAYLNAAAEAANWDRFYARRSARAYRDRHILRGVFPELVSAACARAPRVHVAPLDRGAARTSTCGDMTLLEAGCGHGSAVYPLLRANGRLYALAFDSSARAIELVRAHEEYSAGRMHAFVADVARADSFMARVDARGGAHFVTALWTLSALDVARARLAVGALVAAARAGGLLFVRDFAMGDMREARFEERGGAVEKHEIANVYRRGDGTIAAFFDAEKLGDVFVDAGCAVVRCDVVERDVANRAKGLVMHRRWVQAVFRKAAHDDEERQPHAA
eukprot:IDg17441t1